MLNRPRRNKDLSLLLRSKKRPRPSLKSLKRLRSPISHYRWRITRTKNKSSSQPTRSSQLNRWCGLSRWSITTTKTLLLDWKKSQKSWLQRLNLNLKNKDKKESPLLKKKLSKGKERRVPRERILQKRRQKTWTRKMKLNRKLLNRQLKYQFKLLNLFLNRSLNLVSQISNHLHSFRILLT